MPPKTETAPAALQQTPEAKAPDHTSVDHLYDDPSLDAFGFLYAVMHSPKVDIEHRIACADFLMHHDPMGEHRLPRRDMTTVRIGGIH